MSQPPKVEEIPTPDQIPQKVDLSSLPESVLRSQTIESLIAQNEDLMARLTVTIRRNHLLEEQLQKSRESGQRLSEDCERLSDQTLILKQKDDLWRQKVEAAEEKVRSLQATQELEILKVNEAEEHLKCTTEKFHTKIEKLQAQLSRYIKYRHSIQKRVRPFIDLITNELIDNRSQIESCKQRLFEMKDNVLKITEHFQKQKRNWEESHRQHDEKSRLEIEELNRIVEQLTQQNRNLMEKAQKADSLMERNSLLHNELIQTQRSWQEQQKDSEARTQALNQEVEHCRGKAQESSSALREMHVHQSLLKDSNEKLQGQNRQLTEQLEALQTLWAEKQREFESLKQSQEALKKLNQELSTQILKIRQQHFDPKPVPANRKPSPNPEAKKDSLNQLLNEIVSADTLDFR